MRFLFAPMPFVGHVNPALPMARELVRRGHDVRWYSTPKFRGAIERVGAAFVPIVRPTMIEDGREEEMMPEWVRLKGLAKLRFAIKRVFIDVAPAMLADLEEEFARCPFDVIVGDETTFACRMLAERAGIPWAVAAISTVIAPSVDAAPFGLGIPPMDGTMGRLRNRCLHWAADHVVFAPSVEAYHAMRADCGFDPSKTSLFGESTTADLILQSTIPSFEYPRRDLPPALRFIGASTPEPPQDWTPPDWWPDLLGGRPVVLVTQGTVANVYDELLRPAIRALATEDALVVATTGGKPPEALGIEPLPENVRVAQFISYRRLMPHLRGVVTNGGFGTIQIALMHGLPIAVFGNSEDKMETVTRVRWSGVGVGRKTVAPGESEIRSAVREILGDGRYRRRAETFAEEFRRYDSETLAGDLLESLVAPRPFAARLSYAKAPPR